MKTKSTEFNLRQYRYLAFGIRLQLNNLNDRDKDEKNDLAPILTKLLKAENKFKDEVTKNKLIKQK